VLLNTFAAHQPIIMTVSRIAAIMFVFFFISCTSTKNVTNDNLRLQNNLKGHVSFLADDKLEGRRTGTPGEKLAMEYISEQFQEIGLGPLGSDGYYQPFDVNDGKQMTTLNSFIINEESLTPGKDYFAFPFSPNMSIEALPAISVLEADMPWFIDLEEIMESNKNNPHFDLNEFILTTAKKSKDKGAAAVIFYNSSSIEDKLAFNAKDKTEKLSIPVLYVSGPAAKKYFSDPSATLHMKMKIEIGDKKRTGHNVIGYIDNGADRTVIIGAHFDHLGYGEDGNSMIRNAEKPSIHNGADDNASGTAAMIELARILKNSTAKKNNYLFIAFSGEELGLFGSKYFTEKPTINLAKVNYMINMDMVGRLNDSSKVLTVGGFGTSPEWNKLIYPSVKPSFNIKIDSSGTGPSDHTSFYRKDIPVLFFFTGLHTDYHKPSDDYDKINYSGEAEIIGFITKVIAAADKLDQKLVFTKTRETQTTTSARFSVSLGIMPDYTFSGTGVRADGVSEGRPAAKAGLKTGDIITKLGDHKINTLENYMQALGKFKKGEKTTVEFKRGNENLKATVEF
jgi:aminopeptidase YwaD